LGRSCVVVKNYKRAKSLNISSVSHFTSSCSNMSGLLWLWPEDTELTTFLRYLLLYTIRQSILSKRQRALLLFSRNLELGLKLKRSRSPDILEQEEVK